MGARAAAPLGADAPPRALRAAGGLKATFLASCAYTAIIYIVLVVYIYTVYVKPVSTDLVHDGLRRLSAHMADESSTLFSVDGASLFEAGNYGDPFGINMHNVKMPEKENNNGRPA